MNMNLNVQTTFGRYSVMLWKHFALSWKADFALSSAEPPENTILNGEPA